MSDLAATTTLEKTSLEAHVDLCAMRYSQLDARLKSLETKMDAIQADILEGQRSMKTTLIGSAATILGGLLSLALVIYLN
jgi:hypothetical protein